jgi:hypothetical protein
LRERSFGESSGGKGAAMRSGVASKAIVVVTTVAALVPGAAAHGTTPRPATTGTLIHNERETADDTRRNDTPTTAERIRRFGTGRHEVPRVRIAGVLSTAATDVDFFAVRLEAGDVLGAAVSGSADGLTLYDRSGREAIGSRGNLSILYPASSPLPRGEPGRPVLHFIASRAGWHSMAVHNGAGPYQVTASVFRPGPEQDLRGTTQTLYLDLDGARVDTTNFERFGAVPGVRHLSPLAAFLPRWGLSRSDEPALARVILATARDILDDTLANGANPNAAVRVLSSIDSPDLFGRANVTRVVVGGSIAEAVFTFPTVAVSESIDPGNFAQEETSLILLDLLSGPPDDPSAPLGGQLSLNRYMTSTSDKISFIGRVLGVTAVHEAGHLYGNFHTDPANEPDTLMDGGAPLNIADVFGLGPDGIGGTADDPVVRNVPDAYNPNEAFTGTQDSVNVTAFALSRGRRRS